ncbi:hypothetical protein FRC12_004418 [Ceratobasidium sp. 428]|nr:hypothetical protein FRC12_004418 [Ceratobasidium sp. 428]
MLIISSRPVGWLLGTALYIIGIIHSGVIPDSIGGLGISIAQIVTLGFPICIVAVSVNDVYDYPSDLKNPRKSPMSVEGTLLPPAHHTFVKRAAVVSSIGIIVVSTFPYWHASSAETWQILTPTTSTTALVTLGWMYSAPPFRLKEVPILDSFSNGLIIWLTWFIGYSSSYVLTETRLSFRDIPLEVYMLSIVVTGMHALAAAADIDADTSAGYRTVGTLLGRRACAIYTMIT